MDWGQSPPLENDQIQAKKSASKNLDSGVTPSPPPPFGQCPNMSRFVYGMASFSVVPPFSSFLVALSYTYEEKTCFFEDSQQYATFHIISIVYGQSQLIILMYFKHWFFCNAMAQNCNVLYFIPARDTTSCIAVHCIYLYQTFSDHYWTVLHWILSNSNELERTENCTKLP